MYVAWLAHDRVDPNNVRKVLRESLWLIAFTMAFVVLLLVPWVLVMGWSLRDVVSADLPYSKMRTTVYAVYGGLTAGLLGLLHAAIVALRIRFARSQDIR